MLTGGRTLGMMRTACRHCTRRTGMGLLADGVNDGICSLLSREIATTFSIEVSPDEIQPCHAAQHQVERGPPLKQRCFVRTMDPARGGRTRKENLEALVDPEDVRESLERIG